MTRLSLPEKIMALHRALGVLPHAFGGALALAYYAEPRATVDIDLNVFVSPERAAEVLQPLEALGATAPGASAKARSDGQVRVLWDQTPVDLFFSYDRFHEAVARRAVTVPFADEEIPILAPEHLVVCKATFDRPKDWVDIESMIAAGTHIEAAEVLRWLGRIVGDEDHRYERAAAVLYPSSGI